MANICNEIFLGKQHLMKERQALKLSFHSTLTRLTAQNELHVTCLTINHCLHVTVIFLCSASTDLLSIHKNSVRGHAKECFQMHVAIGIYTADICQCKLKHSQALVQALPTNGLPKLFPQHIP
jgi:hypothetical protein